jgi:serine/threonine protein kinase
VNLVGRQIGSYVVERELGAGGTGTVYLCGHTMIDRKVAVKVLHDDLAYQPDQVARFFQEAKAAAEIGHPNIVVIIDFGTLTVPGGTRSYLMMECLDGDSLDKRLRGETFTLDQIAHILAQICSALVASHGKGIIHRDLKPANVHICPRSFDPLFVKLLDFGIAKLAAPSPDIHRTQYGVVLGTPAYMSPEQCEGKGAIDHRTDIYSLGVMLYELLTGTLPFAGDVRDMMLGHMMMTPPSPRQRNPAVPPEWEALCLHMMEKARDARFQSVSEVAQALTDLRRHASTYTAYLEQRSRDGHAGHTQRLEVTGASQLAADMELATRETLQSSLADLPGVGGAELTSMPWLGAAAQALPRPLAEVPLAEAPLASSSFTVGSAHEAPLQTAALEGGETPVNAIGMAACYALVTDPRHAAFLATLLLRPMARWCNVAELCSASTTAAPAALPPQPLFCAWLDHPWADPGMVAVVFLSLRDGSNTVALCRRVTW